MGKLLRPEWEDKQRYKALTDDRTLFENDMPGEYKPNEYIHEDNDMYALERLLGRQLTAEDFGPEGNLSSTDMLHKLNALKARKSLAEYLIRTKARQDPLAWTIPADALTMAILSFTEPDKLNEYIDDFKYIDNSGGNIATDIFEQIQRDVPEVLYNEYEADKAKNIRREEALDRAAEEGAFDDYGGHKVYYYNKSNPEQLNNELHYFSEPLYTEEEKTALGSIADAIRDRWQ